MTTSELLIWTAISSFAVFRASQLFVMDDGPFMLLKRFRRALGVWASREAGPGLAWTIAEVFRCTFCLGFWLAIIPAIYLSTSVPDFFVLWFGIAGVQAYLQHQSTKNLN